LRIDTIRLTTGDNAPLRMTEDVKAGDSKRVIAGGLIASLLGSLSRFPFAHEHTGKRRRDSCRNRSHRIFERRCLVGSVKVPRSSRCCPRRREPSESRWIQMKTGRSSCALFLIFPVAALSWQQPATTPAPTAPSAVQEGGRSVAETQQALHDLACGRKDVHHRRWTERGPQTLTPQPPDKALIYVVRPTHYGAAVQTKRAADRTWMGVNRVNSYFYFTLDPGPHYFCSEMKNTSPSLLKLGRGRR
jgi:hypothetical protein